MKTIIYALLLEYNIILGCTYYNKPQQITMFEKSKPKSKFHRQ